MNLDFSVIYLSIAPAQYSVLHSRFASRARTLNEGHAAELVFHDTRLA